MPFGCTGLSSVGWLVCYFMGSLEMSNSSMYEKSNFTNLRIFWIKVQNVWIQLLKHVRFYYTSSWYFASLLHLHKIEINAINLEGTALFSSSFQCFNIGLNFRSVAKSQLPVFYYLLKNTNDYRRIVVKMLRLMPDTTDRQNKSPLDFH